MENEIVRALYTNEVLYTIIGPVACTAFDVAMATGGCEAVVESFYSVMDTQMQVGQDHVTLEDRTLVDWAMSNVLHQQMWSIMHLDYTLMETKSLDSHVTELAT